MNKRNLAFMLTVLLGFSSYAEAKDPQEFVATVKSVADAKSKLRSAFVSLDRCQVGSCSNETSILICEIVGALDVKVDGQIVGAMSLGSETIGISPEDLRYMKELFAQCKPTNYQYWNYDRVLHVGYSPDDNADARIRKYLGLKIPRP